MFHSSTSAHCRIYHAVHINWISGLSPHLPWLARYLFDLQSFFICDPVHPTLRVSPKLFMSIIMSSWTPLNHVLPLSLCSISQQNLSTVDSYSATGTAMAVFDIAYYIIYG